MPILTFKLGLFKHLDLADVDIMQRVDGLAGLLNVLANAVRDPGTQHAMVNANVLTSHKAVSELARVAGLK